MTAPNLKPCPFCGGEAADLRMGGLVGCEPCGLARRDAASWNRRDTDQATLAAPPETLALIAAKAARDLQPVITDLLTSSDLLSARWKARSKVVSARLYEHVQTMHAFLASLTNAEAIAAREARDAQMRTEGQVAGLREAAEIAGLNAWKHAGEDEYSRGMDAGAIHQVKACCDAILARAAEIEKGKSDE